MCIILNNFQIIEVSKDKVGNYIKMEVQLQDGTSVIRWGIDDFSYKGIKENVTRNYFDSLEVKYHYEIVPYAITYQEKANSRPIYKGVLRCIQGNRVGRIEFLCSERFAGNLEWFRREVQKVDDIRHLFWENFLET
jgi:hypothetical protein